MESLSPNYVWALSGPVLILYVAAVAIFVAILSANLRVILALTEGARARTPGVAAAFTLFITLVSNFIGVATVVLLGQTSGASPRLSMLAFPVLLTAERHIRHAARHARVRGAHLAALAGGLTGIAAGGWIILRPAVSAEPIARAVVSGEVKTATLDQVVASPDHWAISIQLVLYYCLSLGIFYGAHWCLKLASNSMGEDLRAGRAKALSAALFFALALNFFGVAALVMVGKATAVPIRQAMVLVPLFLIIEAYVGLLRSDRENRLGHWAGLVGSAAGMAGAGIMMLRGAPLH